MLGIYTSVYSSFESNAAIRMLPDAAADVVASLNFLRHVAIRGNAARMEYLNINKTIENETIFSFREAAIVCQNMDLTMSMERK